MDTTFYLSVSSKSILRAHRPLMQPSSSLPILSSVIRASILQSSTSLQIAIEAMHGEGVGLPATDSHGVGIWLGEQAGLPVVVMSMLDVPLVGESETSGAAVVVSLLLGGT